jgi:hypothetical protein
LEPCGFSLSVRFEIATLSPSRAAHPTVDCKPDPGRESDSSSAGTSCRIALAMHILFDLVMPVLRCALAFFRSRREQAIVELVLRQQLSTYAKAGPKPRLGPLDRAFWVALSRLWPSWKDTLVIVKPDTVIRWHRQGFRLYWRSISKPGPGRRRWCMNRNTATAPLVPGVFVRHPPRRIRDFRDPSCRSRCCKQALPPLSATPDAAHATLDRQSSYTERRCFPRGLAGGIPILSSIGDARPL